MDLHLAADHRNYDHHDEDISIISATPDAIVNQVKMLLFIFAPLATVVIGGIISSTVLTLLVLPVLYSLAYRGRPGS